MGGGADEFDAPNMRLVVRLGAFEARQKGVVNVDAFAAEFCRQRVRQHLHVAREHDEFGPRFLHQRPDLPLLLHFRVFGDRQIMERDAAQIQSGIGFHRVVGGDRRRRHFQLADAPAIQQVGQAMVEFADQQQYAARCSVVVENPVQFEGLGDGGEAFPYMGEGLPADQIKADAGEKFAGFGIIKLLGLAYIGALLEEIGGNGGNNAGTVLAG